MSEEQSYILVTGASSGIGRAIAVALSKNNNLILHGRRIDKLEETKSLCDKSHEYLIWAYDLENVDSLQASFEKFVKECGVAITQFVHSAGIVLMPAVKSFNLGMLRKVVDTNATSAILLTSSLLKHKIAGATLKNVVFISSVTGLVGTRGKSLYGTSKGMLNAFVRSSAVELAPKVRINSICPAAVRTEMAEDVFNDANLRAAIERRHPLGSGVPEDVAGVVEFLVSDKSRWITGQQIVVDGGALCDLTFK